MVRALAVLLTTVSSVTASMLDSDANSTGTVLNPNKILCPVLAALHKSGALVVDENGIAERAQIKAALKEGIWCSEDLAEFQSVGIADYDWTHKFDQTSRDRCLPGVTASGALCATRWLAGSTAKEVKRYLNIFQMNGMETVEHGFSTGTRGGNSNSLHDPCNGQYPCEPLFQKFYASKADSKGRIYASQVKQIICHALAEGDRGGEWSYFNGDASVLGLNVATLPARQWQMKAAMMGWLSAFGRADASGELYFTVDDARAMLMEGRVPDGWEKRRWGCITRLGGCPTMPNGKRDMTFLEQVNMDLPCDQDGEWWTAADPNKRTTTGVKCTNGGECKKNSDAHSLCLSHRCTCAKGRNGVQMLFDGHHCVEQASKQYFGSQCRYTQANNPTSPWTWQAMNSSIVV